MALQAPAEAQERAVPRELQARREAQGLAGLPATAAQCPSDGNECTFAECASAACTQTNGPFGVTCDLSGTDDGTCESASNTGAPCAAGDDAGTCQEDGSCFVDLCVDVLCEDGNQCTDDGTCDPATGLCEGAGSSPAGTTCNENDGLVCDGAGSCVDCVVVGSPRRQAAYVKASNTGQGDGFGSSTAIDAHGDRRARGGQRINS